MEGVSSGLDGDGEIDGVPDVVAGHNRENDDVVEDHFSEAASEGHAGSAGELEAEGELVGQVVLVAVAGRRSGKGDDWGKRSDWGKNGNLRGKSGWTVSGWSDDGDDWSWWDDGGRCDH